MTMLAAPLDLSNLGTAVGSTTATKAATGANSAEAAQDRFLKLLVAQLNNQDPLNPMDNAQMTTQMTQISTVSGIEQLNSTLKVMATQYTAMQTLHGTSLIGRDALVAGSGLHFRDGSAQVADLNGQPLGKPGTHERAVAQLRQMRGQTVIFQTAVAVVCQATGFERVDLAQVRVVFRDLGDAEIEHYLRAEQPYDCAGSAKSEGLGIALLERIDNDDPTALVGLPLIRTCQLIRAAGVPVL